ncbi:hypothetical protein BZG36_00177 [Bifiguratus adelaidae]|uniref:SH3 domain-containing protein n=1 Tax=Bifiguratus adelaidae TaxID=1938954 RepID=A0A261Y8J5_9FUNG|nr:hypothetical protein BZG36_00177 [Bifiguratus adelaidae]
MDTSRYAQHILASIKTDLALLSEAQVLSQEAHNAILSQLDSVTLGQDSNKASAAPKPSLPPRSNSGVASRWSYSAPKPSSTQPPPVPTSPPPVRKFTPVVPQVQPPTSQPSYAYPATPNSQTSSYGPPSSSSRPPVSSPGVITVGSEVEAIYDYKGDPIEDLSFRKGDIITITEVVNQDWYRGKIGYRSGMFPDNHVRLINKSNGYAPTPTAYGPVVTTTPEVDPKEEEHNQMKKEFKSAAIHGAGWGVGSAVAGGIVRSIF